MRAIVASVFAVLVSFAIAAPLLAQQRLSRECLTQIRQLCNGDRAAVRACVFENLDELEAQCQAELRQRVTTRTAIQPSAGVRPATIQQTVSYGPHERQAVDFYPAPISASAPPLVVFVHGGGWSFGRRSAVQMKPAHFADQGYTFASAGYRVLPDAPVEEQASDLASAISAIRADADHLRFDPNRIVLMGHSAGAHLVALVASDPQYLGEDTTTLAGVVLLDGAGYDVPYQMANNAGSSARLYNRVFGDDAERQARLSPITHAAAPHAPEWLILHVARRRASRVQSQNLGDALRDAGANVQVTAISGTDHGGMNRNIGSEGDATTAAIDDFLARILN